MLVMLGLGAAFALPTRGHAADRGTLYLTFDDRHFSSWENALPVFAKYGAHATFFVYGPIDASAIATMRRLAAAGHSLGLHGQGHAYACKTSKKLGMEKYLAQEVMPQLEAVRKAGLKVGSWAYPCSDRDAATDAALLRHFRRLRSGGYWERTQNGKLAETDGLFHADRNMPPVVTGASAGLAKPTVTGEVCRVLRRLAERGESAVLYAHNIRTDGVHDDHDLKIDELETILAEARRLGVAVCGFDEMPSAETSSEVIVRRVMDASAEIAAAQAELTDRVAVTDYARLVRRTNDVEVWSDAIAAAIAEHQVVVLPDGREYAIDRPIVLPSNRRMEAMGATVRMLPPAEVAVRTACAADGTFAPTTNPRGANIAVVGGRWIDWSTSRRIGRRPPPPFGERGDVRTMFYFGNADRVAVENVMLENAGGYGILLDNSDSARIAGIRFARCRADGVHVNGNVSRLWIRDIRGEVNDDFIALNGYDWNLAAVNFGPQRDILCEDIVPVDDIRRGYPSIRLLQGVYCYADGSKVDCRLSNAVFRNIRKVLTFKAYLHTQFFVVGEMPEYHEVGTIENVWFDDIDIDLIRPIDGKERCGLTAYSESEPLRGHFAAFEFGTNADGVHFRNVKVRLHPEKWPLSHFMTVGPKSATFRSGAKTVEVFDPDVSCRVSNVTLENVSIEGAPPARHFHETVFDNLNGDGRSSGRGTLELPTRSDK